MTAKLFHNATLIDPEADTPRLGALLVKDGQIAEVFDEGVTPSLPSADLIDCRGKCLAPGIVDIGVKVCEPGARHLESYRSAGHAAAAGGVTTIVTRPDTDPALDSPETLEFARRRAQEAGVRVHAMAALTKGRAGQEMTEIGFLSDAGAVAFTDCDHVTTNTKALQRAFTYARQLGALVMCHVQEPNLSAGAAATSGKFATLRALPAVSPLAERMGLERDMALVEATGVRYHADQITTAAALPTLRRAKDAGLDVTAGVSIHHLTLNALDVADYRTFFKVKPPLRDEDDRRAVVEALREGLIDIIHSMHTPQDEESKRLPFEEAASGAVALETLLPAAMRLHHSEGLSLPQIWRALSLNPARRLGLEGGNLSVGATADLVLFDAGAPFVLDRTTLRSKCKNTPFDGQRMQGRVLATYLGGEVIYERA
ncbi:dihydroorotase [Pseudaestuariivita sp.]|uniref:dihydroorotase n=1 Tax=Pseudaestuariivita sp. TaxID=2211669 RepID=UPI00405916A4